MSHIVAYLSYNPTKSRFIVANSNVTTLPMEGNNLGRIKNFIDQERMSKFIKEERTDGANLGWSLGKLIKPLQQLTQVDKSTTVENLLTSDNYKRRLIADILSIPDCYLFNGRNELVYLSKTQSQLEECMINFLISQTITSTEIRNANAVYAKDFWINVLKPHYEQTPQYENIRIMFNKFLSNRQSPNVAFRIGEVSNYPEIQAFMVLLLTDFNDNRLVSMIIEEKLQKPELLLALYGAIVGYTRFPRILLERDTYLKSTSEIKILPITLTPSALGRMSQNHLLTDIKAKVLKFATGSSKKKCKEFFESVLKELPTTETCDRNVYSILVWKIKTDLSKNKAKWVKELKRLIDEENMLPGLERHNSKKVNTQKPSYLNGNKVADIEFSQLDCLKDASVEVLNRLKENWEYTAEGKDNASEHIDHFINLCYSEGCGRTNRSISSLLGVFTDKLAPKLRCELEELS